MNSSTSDSEDIQDSNLTLDEKLNLMLKESSEIQSATHDTDNNVNVSQIRQQFSKELSLFELTKQRTSNITKVFEAVKTIPATSVEAERAFSAAGLFVTKIRSWLSDKNINALCLLRAYYMNKS